MFVVTSNKLKNNSSGPVRDGLEPDVAREPPVRHHEVGHGRADRFVSIL